MPRCSRLRPVLTVFAALALASASGCGSAQARKAQHMTRGETYLAAENFGKASVEFRNVLQIDPKDPQALYKMGIVQEKLGKPRQAAQFYQATMDVSPDNVDARVGLARLYLFSGAPERALEIVKPGLAKHPDDSGLLTLRAAVRMQQKDVSGALEDASRAVDIAPTNEDAVGTLAGIYKSRGEVAKAQALLEKTIARKPEAVDSRVVLAQIYEQSDRPAEAEAVLLKLIELKPSESANRLLLAQFYLQTKQIDAAEHSVRQAVKDLPADYTLKFALVNFLAAYRSREIAETELKKMMSAAPADNEFKFALAHFYETGKDLAKAEAVYLGIIDKEQFAAAGLTARDRLAELRLQANNVAGAQALVDEVLAKSPRDEYALLIHGKIELMNRDPRAAIADLRALMRDEPTSVVVLQTLARAHLAGGEMESAEKAMRLAVDEDPGNQSLRLELARLLGQVDKLGPAQAIVIDLLRQDPDNTELLDTEFRMSLKMQDYVTAKSAADTIVALRPKFAAGYLYQGQVAEARNHPDEALRLYLTALDMQPDGIEPLEAEVHLLVNEKRIPEALKRLDDVTARVPHSSLAPNIKGNLLMVNGRLAEARDTFKLAIARNPTWWAPYRGLAYSQLALKDPAAAVTTLRNAKPVVAQRDALGEALAELLVSLGKSDEAITEYEEVVRAYPRSEAAANNLAILLATYKKDAASLDRAKALTTHFAESPNPAYLDTYGWVLFKRGDAAAVPVLERVVAKAPNVAAALYHLGMAQSSVGDNSHARDNLMRAVNSGTKFSGLDEARATLQRIANMPDVPRPAPNT